MSAPPVHAAGLGKRFPGRLALEGVDLTVGAGEVVGLVGPNGSGKTTLLKLLAGFLRPTAGTARVFGLDPYADGAHVMEHARFAFAPPALFESLTAREHMLHVTRLGTHAGARVRCADIDAALSLVGLADRAGDRVRAFSFGMRQRLALALALVPRPRLIVLDEPTDGLDPLAVLELRAVLAGLAREEGIAVLLSSHLLIEVEELVDAMLVLHEGRTLFQGAPSALLDGRARVRLEVDDLELGRAALARSGHMACVVGRELELAVELPLEAARTALAAEAVALRSFRVHRPSLEDALLEELRRVRAPRQGGVR